MGENKEASRRTRSSEVDENSASYNNRGTARRKSSKKTPTFSDLDDYQESESEYTTTTTKRQRKPVTTKTVPSFDMDYVKNLAEAFPDTYSSNLVYQEEITGNDQIATGMISLINADNPLSLLTNFDIRDNGPITGMSLSQDGSMLATFCNTGTCKIWDTNNGNLLKSLRDRDESNIDEFYVGKFSPDCSRIVVAGKLKSRERWSEQDDDNHILPCPLKVFDVVTGKVLETHHAHQEEVLCIKLIEFKGDKYYITSSQDGYIIKWNVEEDWTTVVEQSRMDDDITCMAFTVSFLPNTGNKYFIGACDDAIRLYDFEDCQLLKTFEGMYSCYCDCAKFITPSIDTIPLDDMSAYIISRGVEALDTDENTVNSKPNTVALHRLVYPTKKTGEFKLEQVKKYQHEEYRSNSWLSKVTSNGKYVLAGTFDGQVFIFDLASGDTTGILRDHESIEVRDILFHPGKKILFTSSDDGRVKAYTQNLIK